MRSANGTDWRFTSVYASPSEQRRRVLWEALHTTGRNNNMPWIVAGDFNDIADAGEKKGGAAISHRRCASFRKNMEDCKLYDMGSSGPKFTWRGGIYHGGHRIYERLDRAIGNEEWKLLFPDSFIKVLPRVNFSDHHPILIALNRDYYDNGGRQFRFKSAWLMENNYADRVRGFWRHGEDIMSNLNKIKSDAKEWKQWSVNNVQRAKKRILARLKGIQESIHIRNDVRGLTRLEKKTSTGSEIILKQEELMWFQRSQAKWLIDGDRNTKYYHIKTVNRRRKNNIKMLQDSEGNWIDKDEDLKELVNNFYKDLFKIRD
ncbi:uncharacterized protein LOC131636306 [Vicia villosa]|uniref:uncharacterized protein LOC131636306 n=1 Tax=Vicia villosa TaxID=3911 RepID=UPI00273B2073|nr:uncharacterized protein LOC131636306 [Vicia villosa]